jgi:hypothetical protein
LSPGNLYSRLESLPVTVDEVRLERREVAVSSAFSRVTTTVVLEGGGHTGQGEDVTYTADDHEGFPADLPLEGSRTLAEQSAILDGRDLFAAEPAQHAARDYRRWAFESAALDLALRQAGLSLAAALDRTARPVQFVVSTRGDVDAWAAAIPGLEFKLDPDETWDDERMTLLAASGRVRVLDLKAYYHGTGVDLTPDAALYAAVVAHFPNAIIEDAALDGACGEALAPARDRLSFDAPIHSLADIDALPVEPRFINIKPSRFGTVARLLECIEACDARGITMYGGGQFELGPGRAQIQALASVFYPDGPNDVAPGDYNVGDPRPGLPRSPLPPPSGAGLA